MVVLVGVTEAELFNYGDATVLIFDRMLGLLHLILILVSRKLIILHRFRLTKALIPLIIVIIILLKLLIIIIDGRLLCTITVYHVLIVEFKVLLIHF